MNPLIEPPLRPADSTTSSTFFIPQPNSLGGEFGGYGSGSGGREWASAVKANLLNSTAFAKEYPASILLVEDEVLNQKITEMMLQRLGYTRVDTAVNGEEAVAKVATGDYDLVFMDLHMPVMSGLEAVSAIRANSAVKKQPAIVAMTGHVLCGIKDDCQRAGMNGFLTKPVGLADFMAVIAVMVKQAGCRMENGASV